MAVYSSGGELIHHGILGMRWGVRRYQRKDGTLTPAGKRRVKQLRREQYRQNDDNRALDQYEKEQKKKIDKDRARRVAEKEINKLSSEELRARSERIKLENEYRNLAYPEIEENNSRKKKAKELVSKVLRDSTENIGTQAATWAMGSAINALAKSLGIADDDIVNPYKGQGDRPKKKNNDDDKKSEGNSASKQKPKNSRDFMGKGISAMTDDEISSLISRLNNEKSLQQLFDGKKPDNEKKKDK